jgi:hypothetical protein
LPDGYLRRADTVTMLGVIEYVHDVPWLFAALSSYSPMLIVSYNPSDLRHGPRRRFSLLGGLSNGWVNEFTLGELMRIISSSGFIVNELKLISMGQVLVRAVPKSVMA